MTTMAAYLELLKLTTFRNHASVTMELDGGHVVLTGENGAGKTNILEAVSFLSPGRGLRRATYDAIGKQGGNGSWSVFARLQGSAGEVSIGTGQQATAAGVEPGRKVHINGSAAKSSYELLEHCRIVWLTPSMDGLFTGPAADRRRFLDRMVLAVDPDHGKRVSEFEKAMRSRNRLLTEDYPDGTWLDAVETQLASLGVAISVARKELTDFLTSVIVEHHDPQSPFPDAIVSLNGSLEELAGELPSGDLESHYADQLRNSRNLDARAGRTLAGPHRSDLAVQHRPKAMPAEHCSTGEQKALLIGLMLAHARLVASIHGSAPILLLDEVAAHLDENRRSALYDIIDTLGSQAWMTGTDFDFFKSLGNRARFFNVAEGMVAAV